MVPYVFLGFFIVFPFVLGHFVAFGKSCLISFYNRCAVHCFYESQIVAELNKLFIKDKEIVVNKYGM